MKFRSRIRYFFAPQHPGLLSVCLLVPLVSCASSDLSQIAPQTVPEKPAMAAQPTQPDGYPGFDMPAGATPQLDDAETRALTDELTALRLRQAVRAGRISEAERLRILAQMHAEQRLQEIEAGAE